MKKLNAIIFTVLALVFTRPIEAHASTAVAVAEVSQPTEYILSDLEYLALTIWGEARGESRKNMEFVGSVILNRLKSSGLNSIKEVVTQPGQFNVWNRHNANYYKMLSAHKLPSNSGDYLAYVRAREVAKNLLDNGPVCGSTHFNARKGHNVFR